MFLLRNNLLQFYCFLCPAGKLTLSSLYLKFYNIYNRNGIRKVWVQDCVQERTTEKVKRESVRALFHTYSTLWSEKNLDSPKKNFPYLCQLFNFQAQIKQVEKKKRGPCKISSQNDCLWWSQQHQLQKHCSSLRTQVMVTLTTLTNSYANSLSYGEYEVVTLNLYFSLLIIIYLLGLILSNCENKKILQISLGLVHACRNWNNPLQNPTIWML